MAFMDMFIEMRNGGAAIEMQKALEDVGAGVRKTGKPGKVTLTLTITPAEKGSEIDTVFLADTITTVIPKPDKKRTLFFINDDNQLTRHDTRQMNMLDGLKEIDVTARPAPKEL